MHVQYKYPLIKSQADLQKQRQKTGKSLGEIRATAVLMKTKKQTKSTARAATGSARQTRWH